MTKEKDWYPHLKAELQNQQVREKIQLWRVRLGLQIILTLTMPVHDGLNGLSMRLACIARLPTRVIHANGLCNDEWFGKVEEECGKRQVFVKNSLVKFTWLPGGPDLRLVEIRLRRHL